MVGWGQFEFDNGKKAVLNDPSVAESGKKGSKVVTLEKSYFRGQSIARLDAKGRLRVPTKFRDVLQVRQSDALIITRLDKCLVAYPIDYWQQIENKVLGLSQIQPQHRTFIRHFISGAEECEFDGQGRILIPPLLREKVQLGQEVLLAGMLSSFEIWNRDAWEKHSEWGSDHFLEIALDIANTGF